MLRPLYPEPDLAGARRRLTLFLAQYWGGPTDVRRGARPPAAADAPRAVRDRRGERDRWLVHMRAAVARVEPAAGVAAELRASTSTMAAEAMRNRD